jgi:hypothetical protein
MRVELTRVTIKSRPANSSVGVGATLRHPSFQERAHSSSVAPAVIVRRETSEADRSPTPTPQEKRPEGSLQDEHPRPDSAK